MQGTLSLACYVMRLYRRSPMACLCCASVLGDEVIISIYARMHYPGMQLCFIVTLSVMHLLSQAALFCAPSPDQRLHSVQSGSAVHQPDGSPGRAHAPAVQGLQRHDQLGHCGGRTTCGSEQPREVHALHQEGGVCGGVCVVRWSVSKLGWLLRSDLRGGVFVPRPVAPSPAVSALGAGAYTHRLSSCSGLPPPGLIPWREESSSITQSEMWQYCCPVEVIYSEYPRSRSLGSATGFPSACRSVCGGR